jgi:hypothetical protein
MWIIEAIEDRIFLGAIGDEFRLNLIEKAMFFTPDDRLGDDDEMLNPTAQLYDIVVDRPVSDGEEPSRFCARPLLRNELKGFIQLWMLEDEDAMLPADLAADLVDLDTMSGIYEWGKDAYNVRIERLGPMNLRIV